MSELKDAAVAVDKALAELEAAWDTFMQTALAEDRNFREEQKAKPRVGWAKRNPAVQSHPIFGMPHKLLRSAVGGRLGLAKALRIDVTQTKGLVDLVK